MTNFSLNAQARKAIEGLLLLAGTVLTVYNLFAFTVSKAGGYFFRSGNQIRLEGVAQFVDRLFRRPVFQRNPHHREHAELASGS